MKRFLTRTPQPPATEIHADSNRPAPTNLNTVGNGIHTAGDSIAPTVKLADCQPVNSQAAT